MTLISERLARFSANLQLADVPAVVTATTIRLLADTLGCAIAASVEPNARAIDIVVDYATRDRARQEATIIGRDWKTSLRSAALANCTMARYLDANDIYMPISGSLSGSGHFSDAIPALIAAAEKSNVSGAALLEAIVVSYEIQASLADSMPWLDLGLHSVSQVSVAVALAAGRLLGLNEIQLAHSASLAITSGLFLQSWLKPSDDVPAIKGGAPGLAAERGITCAELAAAGFTGPLDAFETFYARFGTGEVASDHCFERLGQEWFTPRNAIKAVPAQIYTQAVVQCARQLYCDGLRLNALRALTVYSNDGACARVQGSPGAFRPASREAADHSTPFVTVMTLRDGNISALTYHDEAWLSENILSAMARVTLVVDEGWSARLEQSGLLGAEIVAEDDDGRKYAARIDQFRGHPDNPISREELGGKLTSLCAGESDLDPNMGTKLLEICEALPASPDVCPIIASWTESPSRS
jgi:2-methylcitrate dehydratase